MYGYHTPQLNRRSPDYDSHNYYTPQPKKRNFYKLKAPFAVYGPEKKRRSGTRTYPVKGRDRERRYSFEGRNRNKTFSTPRKRRYSENYNYRDVDNNSVLETPSVSSAGPPPAKIKYMWMGKDWKSNMKNEFSKKLAYRTEITEQMEQDQARKEYKKLREKERARKEEEDIEKYWEMVREREMRTQPFLRRKGVFASPLPPKRHFGGKNVLAPRGAFTYSEPTRVTDKLERWKKQNDFKASLDEQLRLKNKRKEMEEEDERLKDLKEEQQLRMFHGLKNRRRPFFQSQNQQKRSQQQQPSHQDTSSSHQQNQPSQQQQQQQQKQPMFINPPQIVQGPYNNLYKNLLYQQKQEILKETNQKQVEFLSPLLSFFKETVKNFAVNHISQAYTIKGKELRDELRTTIRDFIIGQQKRLNEQQKKFETLVLEREILGWGRDEDVYKVQYVPRRDRVKVQKKRRTRRKNGRNGRRRGNNNNNNMIVVGGKNSHWDFTDVHDIDETFLDDIVDDTISVITNTSYCGSNKNLGRGRRGGGDGNELLETDTDYLFPIVRKVGRMVTRNVKKKNRKKKSIKGDRGSKLRKREEKLDRILKVRDHREKEKVIDEYIRLPQL